MAAVAVVGAGAWGTALAVLCARAGHRVSLWARNPGPIDAARESPRLPGVALPPNVVVVDTLPGAAEAVLMATPVRHLRAALALPRPRVPLVLCMKGLEAGTALFPAEIVQSHSPEAAVAVLSGPNFAHEVAAGLPAAAALAAADPVLRARLAALLHGPAFRLYGNDDPVGVQLGGAAKNVIALAAGAVVGAGLGENARAALVTRGLAELGRLVVAGGGRAETVAGLSGLGDLLLTCTGAASRNFRCGLALGRGHPLPEALLAAGGTVEGVLTAPALLNRAAELELPVVAAVAALLAARATVADTVATLLARPLKDE